VPTPTVEKTVGNDGAADYLGVSRKTLPTWRTKGRSPPFCKIGKRVVYRLSDLDAFLARAVRTSTRDRIE